MSHAHHDHDHHGHAPHDHGHPRPAPSATELSGSLLRASAATRLGVAAAMVAVIWGGVFWAAS